MTRKKMLCINMIKNKSCPYGYKCMYAHNLDEQTIDPIKKDAYDIIKSNGIYNADLSQNDDLARIFLIYTKVCNDCKNKKCTGGYNCKYGVVDDKYQVCHSDLMYGTCYDSTCKKIHITKKGVLPIVKKQEAIKEQKHDITKTREKLLNTHIFMNVSKDSKFVSSQYDSDNDESPTSIEKTKKYLNEYDSDEECEESIFIYNQQ